jgi:hypothetical protein
MTDVVIARDATPAKTPRKRRKARKAAAAAKPKALTASPEFAGLTPKNCCADCNPEQGCIITRGGSGFCGHPHHGGLQSADALKPGIVACYGRAKKALQIAKIEKE